MDKTDNNFRSLFGKMFAEMEKESEAFKSDFRRWPFIIWLGLGLSIGAYSILLPPGPRSGFFIDPSIKMIFVPLIFWAMTLKPLAEFAAKKPIHKKD